MLSVIIKNKTSTIEVKQILTIQYVKTGLLFSLPSVSEESKTIFVFHCQVRLPRIYIRWAIADKFITVLTYQLRLSLECIIPLQASSPSCTRTRVFSALTTRRKVKQNSFYCNHNRSVLNILDKYVSGMYPKIYTIPLPPIYRSN